MLYGLAAGSGETWTAAELTRTGRPVQGRTDRASADLLGRPSAPGEAERGPGEERSRQTARKPTLRGRRRGRHAGPQWPRWHLRTGVSKPVRRLGALRRRPEARGASAGELKELTACSATCRSALGVRTPGGVVAYVNLLPRPRGDAT